MSTKFAHALLVFMILETVSGGLILSTIKKGICKGREALHSVGNLFLPHEEHGCKNDTQKQEKDHGKKDEEIEPARDKDKDEYKEIESTTLPPIDVRGSMDNSTENVTLEGRFLVNVDCKAGMAKARDGSCREIV